MGEDKKSGSEDQFTTWKDFLESTPPSGKIHRISKVFELRKQAPVKSGTANVLVQPKEMQYCLNTPNLEVFCLSSVCGGNRQFSSNDSFGTIKANVFINHFLVYRCDNCKLYEKVFAVSVKAQGLSNIADVLKIGEYPPYGPHIPKRLEKLFVKENLELFRQGRRAENHGLGIGALTYYRRVVENQKTELIEKIIAVAKKEGASKEMVEGLMEAKREKKFSKSVDIIKDTIPESLKIKTHNPLTLLHQPLSVNIHSKTDQECLALATHIRTILTTFSEKLNEALKDDAELNEAIGALTSKSQENAH